MKFATLSVIAAISTLSEIVMVFGSPIGTPTTNSISFHPHRSRTVATVDAPRSSALSACTTFDLSNTVFPAVRRLSIEAKKTPRDWFFVNYADDYE
ncbi:hypothetical protein B0H19DRAFT_1252245 [Mycena capillaripes]|nr:hypothetical protein B0H19DRAFT_1252245 [Mycena capillaripes]